LLVPRRDPWCSVPALVWSLPSSRHLGELFGDGDYTGRANQQEAARVPFQCQPVVAGM